MLNLPSFYVDPVVPKAQDQLYTLGGDLLTGKIPEFYKGIATPGGSEFEEMVSMTKRDVEKSALEDSVRRGSRGGTSKVTRTVADAVKALRYADLTRAMDGKRFFFNTGATLVGDVRNAGVTLGGQRNDFNMSVAQMENEERRYQEALAAQKKKEKSSMWKSILSAGIGMAGNLAGIGMLNGAFSAAGGAASAGGLGASIPGVSGLLEGSTFANKSYYNF